MAEASHNSPEKSRSSTVIWWGKGPVAVRATQPLTSFRLLFLPAAPFRSIDLKLQNVISKLQIGISKLQIGVSKLQDGISKLQIGISKLQIGISKLQIGISKLQNVVSKLQNGVCAVPAPFFASFWLQWRVKRYRLASPL